MSVVSNVILVFSVQEDTKKVLEKLKEFKYPHDIPFRPKSVHDESLPTKWYGGNKMLEVNICIGAYDHLDIDGLVSFLGSMEWEFSEAVQLIVRRQEEFRFSIINIFPDEGE